MRYLAYIGATLLLGGCVFVTPVTGPDGKQAFSMNCGAHRAACFQKAGELCPAGYNVIDAAQGVVGTATVIAPRNELTVSCK